MRKRRPREKSYQLLQELRVAFPDETWVQIGARIGLSRSGTFEVLYDPTGAKARSRKEKAYKVQCPQCGGPMWYDAGVKGQPGVRRPTMLCKDCRVVQMRREQQLRVGHGKRQLQALALLAAEGEVRYGAFPGLLSISEDHVGILLHRLRQHGLIERPSRGIYVITEAGLKVLQDEGLL